jgi:hypothetical protein
LTICKARSVVPRLFTVITVAESRTRVNTSQSDQNNKPQKSEMSDSKISCTVSRISLGIHT